MTNKIKIAIADDEILIRKGIKAILEQEDNFEVVFEASNGNELIDYLNSENELPEIILMDIRMPLLNGLETTKLINKNLPNIKIVALSSYNSPTFIYNMLDVGAVCYISKSASQEKMISSINTVVQNGFYFENVILDYINTGLEKSKSLFDNDFLTERETEVLKLICEQKSATEIGNILNISSRTVDGHRNNLLLKTESKNVIGLVLFAIQNNIYMP
jgi:DNA-binding NarL/FixJ family response regulator